MQRGKTENFGDFQKVTEVVWRSRELPPTKIDTPISVQADEGQAKEACKGAKRKIT